MVAYILTNDAMRLQTSGTVCKAHPQEHCYNGRLQSSFLLMIFEIGIMYTTLGLSESEIRNLDLLESRTGQAAELPRELPREL